MKKVLYLLFLLLIPFMVKAEVKITNVELIEYSEYLEVDEHPEFEGLKLDFNLKFNVVGEYVKYKITIKNEDSKDYEIEVGSKTSPDGFIRYEITYEGEDNILKTGTEKEIFTTVKYDKLVDKSAFKEGKYNETGTMEIDLSNDDKKEEPEKPVDPEPEQTESETVVEEKEEVKEENPKTVVGYYVLGISIILFISLIILLISKKRLSYLSVFLMGVLLIPIAVYALEKITIEVDANIEIEEYDEFTLYKCENSEKAMTIVYKPGSTWNEFFESTYYNVLDTNFKEDFKKSIVGSPSFNGYNKDYDECLNNIKKDFDQGLIITDEEINNRMDECENNYYEEVPISLDSPIYNSEMASYNICIK